MNNYNYAFVILHYNEVNSTIKCIDTLLSPQYNHTINIVVVDNCSPDNSGYILKEKYSHNPLIHVLQNDSNLGFAKANNVGYQYAQNVLNADFICILNNDVYISQPDFISISITEYEKSHAGIIGPHIELPDNRINYMYLKLHPMRYYEKQLKHEKKVFQLYSSKNCFPRIFLYNLKIIIYDWLHRPSKKEEYEMLTASKMHHENIILHGCCLIFTPIYVSNFAYAFNPNTFMFREEELLYLHCQNNHIKTVYAPTLSILHVEDIATNATFRKKRERELWRSKCQIDSLTLLINELSSNS